LSEFNSILVTGGCGFIGSHLVRLALQRYPNSKIINYDVLTYAANPSNLHDCQGHPNYRFIRGDVRDAKSVLTAMEESGCDTVVHLAAESHVDRSILDSDSCVTTNILGTHVLLEAAVKLGIKRFVYVSTDEVYGSIEEPQVADESTILEPNSPYAVAKASADLMARTYNVTYGLPVVITRACNNFGPNQYPEKLIPLFISNLLEGKKVPLYGDGLNVRDWIYVIDHCEALLKVLDDGKEGEIYNIGGNNPRTNLELVTKLLKHLGKDESSIEYVEDRPGHDRRYAIDSSKIAHQLNWKLQSNFDEALDQTIDWYCQNRGWWHSIKSGEFQDYYQTQYGPPTP